MTIGPPAHRRPRASRSLRTDLALDGLEQGDRHSKPFGKLIHHSDRETQSHFIRYTERPVEVCVNPSVGSPGDSYDNALAEPVILALQDRADQSPKTPEGRGRVRNLLEPIGTFP